MERRAAQANGLTVKEYGEKWLESRSKELKPNTLDHYSQVLQDHVYPALGSRALPDLTRPILKTWLVLAKRIKAGKLDEDRRTVGLTRDVKEPGHPFACHAE